MSNAQDQIVKAAEEFCHDAAYYDNEVGVPNNVSENLYQIPVFCALMQACGWEWKDGEWVVADE